MARLWAAAAADIGHISAWSTSLLFIDLSAAFASVVRELVLPVPSSADELAHRLGSRGFTPAQVRHCMQATAAYEEWTAGGDKRHLSALIAAIHTGSWFSIALADSLWESWSGSLAGSSLGDLVFLLAFSVVMRDVNSELHSQDLITSVPTAAAPPLRAQDLSEPPQLPEAVPLESVEYMDDVVVPIFAVAEAIVSKVAVVASCVHGVFARYALKVNFAPGKSEALMVFRGEGAKASEQALHHTAGSSIPLRHSAHGVALRVVRDYRHLGSRVDLAENLHADLTAKLGGMAATTSALRGRLFRNPLVQDSSKATIASALLFAKGMHAAGTWPDLQQREAYRIHVAVMRVYRLLAGCGKSNVESLDLLASRGYTVPALLVRLARLRLLSRVVARAPLHLRLVLWTAREAPRSWLRAVLSDVQALGLDPSFGPVAGESILSAWQAAELAPKAVRKAAAAAIRHPDVMERAMIAVKR